MGSEIKGMTIPELESWFLSALEQTPINLHEIPNWLGALVDRGELSKADEWVDLLCDALIRQQNGLGLLDVLQWQAAYHAGDPKFKGKCAAGCESFFKDGPQSALIKHAGFAVPQVAASEALRRLAKLLQLKPGVPCNDKTWGFGIVQRVDEFYGKIIVDFKKKAAHQMTLAYAAETLDLPSADHVLMRHHRDPEGTARWIESAPAEVVKCMLASYGPLLVDQVKNVLVAEQLLAEVNWKKFWDDARKQLKNDSTVEIPIRRADPLRLVANRMAFDDGWFDALKAMRDPALIYRQAELLAAELEARTETEAHGAIMCERLAFSIKAVRGTNVMLLGQFLMLTEGALGRLPCPAEVRAFLDGEKKIGLDSLFVRTTFRACLEDLPARDRGRLLQFLTLKNAADTAQMALDVFPQLSAVALDPVVRYLLDTERVPDLLEAIHTVLRQRMPPPELLSWMADHLEFVHGEGLADLVEMALRILDLFDAPPANASVKIQKQLRSQFEDRTWLRKVLEAIDSRRREMLLVRIRSARNWNDNNRQAAIVMVTRLYPELDWVRTGVENRRKEEAPPRVTSWRSFSDRVAQLKKLVEATLPANSRDIAHARSYGDLRENFEYQTAKDQQRMLLQRKQELESDLEQVKGTDFSGLSNARPGMGTCVVITRANGQQESYCILGEWDRDESLGIISNRSKLAEAFMDHVAGDDVTIPSVAGDERCRIESAGGLPDEVKAWIMGSPSQPESGPS